MYLNVRLKLSRTTIDRKIEDMLLLGLLRKESSESNNRPGNPGYYFVVNEQMQKLWNSTKRGV